ncbi:Ribosomal large subunit pseudouridine synthase D [Planctomycetes bacterium MalM25]|nr:Ribosomal large subunit pseudouridine synthase D [Planctomycetes bacterium MalM25]
MPSGSLQVVYEDNHLLAVAKPPGVATMGAAAGETTVLDLAKQHLKEKYAKPGEVYLGVVSRLDKPVTGVLLFARTSKAAARLTKAFGSRRVEKVYLATVAGEVAPHDEPVVHHLRKDDRNQRMHTTHADASGAQRAELSYKVLLAQQDKSLLAVRLQTGRKHQIRVQLAKLGHPILGDEKYGGEAGYTPGIALHSWRLALEHPVRREPLSLSYPPAEGWGRWDGAALLRAMKGA